MSTYQKDTTVELHRLYENRNQNSNWLYNQLEHLAGQVDTHVCGNGRFELLELNIKPDRISHDFNERALVRALNALAGKAFDHGAITDPGGFGKALNQPRSPLR